MPSFTRAAVLIACACTFSTFAGVATTHIDTFDDGTNPSAWNWGGSPAVVQPTGGNPNGYLRTQPSQLNTGAWLTTSPTYTGNFFEKGVTSIGADFFSFVGDPNNDFLSILLVNNGPTASFDDNSYAMYLSDIPSPDTPSDGWVSADFDIPVNSPTTPDGWFMSGLFFEDPSLVTWPEMMADVDFVLLGYGDQIHPILFFNVTRGMDNARITTIPAPGAALVLGGFAATMFRRRRS